MPREVGPTFKGQDQSNLTTGPDLNRATPALPSSAGPAVPGLRGLLLQVRSVYPAAFRQLTDKLKGEPTGVLDIATIRTVAADVYRSVLDTMNRGPAQTGVDAETLYREVWLRMQTYIAQTSNDDTYLQNALVTMTEVVLDQITPQATINRRNAPAGPATGAALASLPMPDDCPEGASAQIATVPVQPPPASAPRPVSKDALPRPLTERQAEFCVTEATHLVTSGPVARKILRLVKEGGAKHSAAMEPVWITFTQQLADADQKALGNWIATHPKGQTQAGRAIVENSLALNQAHVLLQSVNKTQQTDEDFDEAVEHATRWGIAGTESVWEEMIGQDDQRATWELSRALMRMRYQLSPISVVAVVAAAERDERVLASGVLKELGPKRLRDKGRKRSVQSIDGTPVVTPHEPTDGAAPANRPTYEPIIVTTADLPQTLQMEESQLRRAVAKAVCSDMGRYAGDESAVQPLTLDKILWQFSRKVNKPGIALLEVGANQDPQRKTLQPYEVAVQEMLFSATEALGILAEHATVHMPESSAENTILNRNERTAVLLTSMSQILSERRGENDIVKNQARHQYVHTLLRLFDQREALDPVVREALDYSMKTIGMSWPEQAVRYLAYQYAGLAINGAGRHNNMVEFAYGIGVTDPTYIFNPSGRAIPDAWEAGKPIQVTRGAAAVCEVMLNIVDRWNTLYLPEDGDHRFIAELSRLSTSHQLGYLAEQIRLNPSDLNIYNLAAGVRFLYRGDEALQRQAERILASYKVEDPKKAARVVRLGKTPLFRLAETAPAVQGTVASRDVANVLAAVELLRRNQVGLLEGSVRTVARLGTNPQKTELAILIGERLSAEVDLTLRTHQESPAPLRYLLQGLDKRLQAVQLAVQESATALLNAGSLAGFFQEDINTAILRRARSGDVAQQLNAIQDRVKSERERLTAALSTAQQTLVLPLEGRVADRQTRTVDLTERLYQGAMGEVLGFDSIMNVGAMLGKVAGEDGNGSEAGETKPRKNKKKATPPPLNQIADMIGAAGAGFALAKGEQARVATGAMVAGSASALAQQNAALSAADAAAYSEGSAAFFAKQRAAIEAVAQARIDYLTAVAREVSQTQSEELTAAISVVRRGTQTQYENLRRLMTQVQTAMNNVLAMRAEVLTRRVGEAAEVTHWVKQFEDEYFPALYAMRRALIDGYELTIDLQLPDVEKLLGTPLEFGPDPAKAERVIDIPPSDVRVVQETQN